MGTSKSHQPHLMSPDLMQARSSPLGPLWTELLVTPKPSRTGQACLAAIAALRPCSARSAGLSSGLVQVGGT